jgi:hypothetical protein
MANPTGELTSAAPRLAFDRRLRLGFRASAITSGAALPACRAMDDAPGSTIALGTLLAAPRGADDRELLRPALPLAGAHV